MNRARTLFLLLAAVLVASRLCHVSILWEGDTLPLATARQMLAGRTIYSGIWFDKPPLLPAVYVLWGAREGWPLRLGGALYAILACWIAFRMARSLWSDREGVWAAGLLGFFLVFDFPSAIIPVASDLLMLAPHLAAVWMASQNRPWWSGVLAGIAFWVSPKGVFVAAACALWNPAGIPLMAAGFATATGAATLWLWADGALGAYWEQVWQWGRLYASSAIVPSPLRNGLLRTANWLGFHAALVIAAGRALWNIRDRRLVWLGWILLSFVALTAGMRFFPRYFFVLLAPLVILASRGFTIFGRRRDIVALLLLIPATRFGPGYLAALYDRNWRDTGMDRDSRTAAALVRRHAQPGDTLFVWGYRPEIYIYSRLPAATKYLDSQPLTGVPADRHLTQSEPVETEGPARRRLELAATRPTFVLDGLGLYNPRLALSSYPELRQWLAGYREVARSGQTVIYRRDSP